MFDNEDLLFFCRSAPREKIFSKLFSDSEIDRFRKLARDRKGERGRERMRPRKRERKSVVIVQPFVKSFSDISQFIICWLGALLSGYRVG